MKWLIHEAFLFDSVLRAFKFRRLPKMSLAHSSKIDEPTALVMSELMFDILKKDKYSYNTNHLEWKRETERERETKKNVEKN